MKLPPMKPQPSTLPPEETPTAVELLREERNRIANDKDDFAAFRLRLEEF